MRIVLARRISQVFFVLLFLWFCVVSSLGAQWWQLRGWPVNWFLELDPLVALATTLASGVLYAGLLWALVTLALSILLGRVFCGWVCPFGALHQFIGWLGRRRQGARRKVALNQPHPAQAVKYYILFFVLGAAAGSLLGRLLALPARNGGAALIVAAVLAAVMAWLAARRILQRPTQALILTGAFIAAWLVIGRFWPLGGALAASLQSGLLDPIPLAQRSINLALLPWADTGANHLWPSGRVTNGAWFIGAIFLAALALNLWRPRFYCRFVCPLGALLGLLGHFAPWRIGRREADCPACNLCGHDCEGACQPAGQLIHGECVMCFNCLDGCIHDQIVFSTARSAAGERATPDLTRRGVVIALASGVALAPLSRLAAGLGPNWPAEAVRPPGALPEAEFLKRCIKCGQCMRVCPTNVIQPAWLEAGLEGIWTPVLNFRAGTSGCQLTCVACGHLCPSGAIAPLSLDQRMGRGQFASQGPVRLGTAFLDRGRCLPWAMDRPCIVCQENCPVSPKAILTRVHFSTLRQGRRPVAGGQGDRLRLAGPPLKPGRLATGDYYALLPKADRRRIIANTEDEITLAKAAAVAAGDQVELQVRLQQPQVDPSRCIGCGICQHECPVAGRPAIRVTAENQTRAGRRAFL